MDSFRSPLIAGGRVVAREFRVFARFQVRPLTWRSLPGRTNVSIRDQGGEIDRRLATRKERFRRRTLHSLQAGHSFLLLLLGRRAPLILGMPRGQFAVLADHDPAKDDQQAAGHEQGGRKQRQAFHSMQF